MKTISYLLCAFFMVTAQANVIDLKSRIYGGELYKNDHSTGSACYVQINNVVENSKKGKHCNDLNVQMMFGLDDIGVHSREMELYLGSRKTNTDAEFRKPTTCAEVVGGVPSPWEVDRWGDDTTLLYNQIFNNEYKVNKGTNHYILIFKSSSKEPTRAMIHRVTWLREDSYECRNLMSM
nr:hypothetical protein BHI3_27370 [Bacteriovorax sp. HI3]